ncbi:pirin family protein [Echinicola strongylocentroti]|uniref:Pirin family protein n=1 Tax=Echinicola strongylocentroti TaxID=1795355 RepID=A0A2Z4INZ6_9BACT|nr:pirin family protein [Echinicola strongylocentroti]AWW32480.1 pirin family protein [Echinicola strongylocentroti]
MSNKDLIIPERSRDIGDFLVGRLLPFRTKRMVGPFVFIDHMGPSEVKPGHYMDIGQHPHIGLSTLTFLLEGEMVHEDSLGTKQRIAPGSVNWMTAGRGVTHTERTPPDMRNGGTYPIHGYQIWVALPKEKEFIEPQFHHIDAKDLPQWIDQGASFTLVAGKGYGKTSPVPVHSELFMIDIKTSADYDLEIVGHLEGEIGICIVTGEVNACDNVVRKDNLLVSKIDNQCALKVKKDSHIILFGGPAFPEERFIEWNFVASEKSTIETAKAKWKSKDWPMVKGDDSYIPWP